MGKTNAIFTVFLLWLDSGIHASVHLITTLFNHSNILRAFSFIYQLIIWAQSESNNDHLRDNTFFYNVFKDVPRLNKNQNSFDRIIKKGKKFGAILSRFIEFIKKRKDSRVLNTCLDKHFSTKP